MTRNEKIYMTMIDHPGLHYILTACGDLVYTNCITCNKTYRDVQIGTKVEKEEEKGTALPSIG